MVESVFPIIATPDLDRSLGFWRDVLGGQVSYQFPPDREPDYVGIDLGVSHLGIGVERSPTSTSAGARVSLWCYVADCDEVVERVRAAGHPVVEEPVDQPWGERVARVEDPDGNRVIVGAKR